MPGSKKVKHPVLDCEITFTEETHSYMDKFDIPYCSVTQLVHKAFKPFNVEETAKRKSIETGIPVEQYLAQWEAAGLKAARNGTRCHENCEQQILGNYNNLHKPENEDERIRFRAAWHQVESLKKEFDSMEPEKLVFSPRFQVAGSIDILAKTKDEYAIIDWKYIKELSRKGYSRGINYATKHLEDSNFNIYSLQLNLYEMILKQDMYIPFDAKVKKILLVYRQESGKFDRVDVDDFHVEALSLLLQNVTSSETLPF